MALTVSQGIMKCCGFYCAMLACVGVYFYLVMAFFQSQANQFLIQELEHFPGSANAGSPQNPYYDQSTWVNSFLITAGVSIIRSLY
jgi:hypothetical protein